MNYLLPKVAFYTLGCRLNQAETEKLMNTFRLRGFDVISFSSKANFYIINTCSVTSIADKKSKVVIKNAKKRNSKAKIVVIGCGANSKTLKNNLIDLIIPNDKKERVLEILEQKFYSDISRRKEKEGYDNLDKKLFQNLLHTRAFIKIQDGCNNFCSYCIVPYLRGREVSYSYADIVFEIKQKEKEGYKEVVLIGVNVGRYKSKVGVDLVGLIKKILNETNVFRIRLSSINPQDVTDGLIRLWKNNPRLCRHFHLSLQSGSDLVLKRMNRKYSTSDYIKVVNKIRKVIPDICLTTDIIVGFPGETDKEFKKTYYFIKKIGFAKVHVFRYSPRTETKAAFMSDQVSESIKKDRSKKLRELSNKLEGEYKRKFAGKKLEVLFEEKKNDYWVGLTDNYLRVKYRNKANLKNKIVKMKLKVVKDKYLIKK